MSFIYYVLLLMLSFTSPVYAGLEIEKELEVEKEYQIEEDFLVEDVPQYAQAEIEVGELPSGKIKVFTDQTHSKTILVGKQDCSIMRKEDDSVAFGWKFGGLMWGFGPEIRVGHSSGVAWKADVQKMVAEYQELCTQFNTGRLSQQEYQAEKQQIVQRGYNYARELEKRFKQKKDDLFEEMDEGKYIHLQNTRFYEGCCYHYMNPENNLVAETQPERSLEFEARMQDLQRQTKVAEYQWKVRQCRNTGWCNGRQVRLYRPFQGQRRSNRDLNWDVYGNSNGNWNLGMQRGW